MIHNCRPGDAPLPDPYVTDAARDERAAPPVSLRPPAPLRRRRQGWLTALAVGGFVSLLGAATLVAWGAYQWRELMAERRHLGDRGDGSKTHQAAHSGSEPGAAAATGAPQSPSAAAKVPEDTRETNLGSIALVDLGLSSAPLKETLVAQSALANLKQQTLLVMITGTGCGPCRGVDASFGHPLMQQALRGVRVVRIDLRAFREELEALKMPVDRYPVFMLLDADMTPLDSIHGGEWNEDVAANIAPVLGAFVLRRYPNRRHPEWTPKTGGVQL